MDYDEAAKYLLDQIWAGQCTRNLIGTLKFNARGNNGYSFTDARLPNQLCPDNDRIDTAPACTSGSDTKCTTRVRKPAACPWQP